jgi:predicted metal-dependent hydrolase
MRIDKRTVSLEGIGEVSFRPHSRSRRVAIHVKPFEGIRVSFPRTLSERTARAMVFGQADWIRARLREVRQSEEMMFRRAMSGALLTREHRLECQEGTRDGVTLRVAGGVIRVRHPRNVTPEDGRLRRAVWKGVLAACRKEGKHYLPSRLAALASVHGFRYAGVKVKNLRSRWGSCSRRGNINLNLRLMRLPDRLIDYVILHELVHTEIQNHGPEYWRRFESCLPGAREIDRELNRTELLP